MYPLGDHYVLFDCSALEGYEAVKAAVEAKGEHTMEQVCSTPTISRLYGFGAAIQFAIVDDPLIKNNVVLSMHRRQGGEYDLRSIMHYGSGAGGAVRKYPLRRWNNGGPNYNPPSQPQLSDSSWIYNVPGPSPLDVAAIKMIYPW